MLSLFFFNIFFYKYKYYQDEDDILETQRVAEELGHSLEKDRYEFNLKLKPSIFNDNDLNVLKHSEDGLF